MEETTRNFIEAFVQEDLSEGHRCYGMQIHTRFPPEPNGYLHIGHCKALTIDFSTAEHFGGICNLRMDDTNPAKEDTEYVDAIKEDIHWLGFDWGDRFYYGSDYFEKTYEYAIELIKKGLAYVCELTPEQFREYRGDTSHPAVSPWRDRPIEENLDLFERMKNGEFEEGRYTLRAKIDLASGNFNMRDPVLYRIRYIEHHRQGTKWCIFPMYDFAHPIQDALEGITHSLCSLEYEAHRPLYDWVVSNVSIPGIKPRQIEFSRLGINYTVMSKRKLRQLVEEHRVSGWDDPRMPTLCGLRRRGYTPSSIKNFINRIGYTKYEALNHIELLEHSVREDLNDSATRISAVLNPVKLILTNYPEDQTEMLTMDNNPEHPEEGTHEMPFSRELWIERDDFMENPPKKFFRMTPGKEVRLKGAYIVCCTGVKKDSDGNIEEIYATYDPETRSGLPGADRKVKGTLHWVSVADAVPAEVRQYDRLFAVENPSAEEGDFRDLLNPDSLKVIEKAWIEPWGAARAKAGDHYQFTRLGYYTVDPDTTPDRLVYNKTIGLKDTWAKELKKM